MSEKKVCKSICRMCGSGCGIEVQIEDNKLVRISGDKDNHINRGRICIKGSSAVTWLDSPERLRKPKAHGKRFCGNSVGAGNG